LLATQAAAFISTTQVAFSNVQHAQAIDANFQAILNRQAAVQAYPIIMPNSLIGTEDNSNSDSDSSEFDGVSVISHHSDQSKTGFQRRHPNQEATLEENGHINGSGEGPDPSDENTTTLRFNNERPNFSIGQLTDSPIASILPDFLARMEAANKELEVERAAGTLNNRRIEIDENLSGSEDGQFIEMNLGLGVLEERNGTASESSDNDSSNNDAGEDVMQKLLGNKRKRDTEKGDQLEVKKPKIEEL
jgi:hypothetical protein